MWKHKAIGQPQGTIGHHRKTISKPATPQEISIKTTGLPEDH